MRALFSQENVVLALNALIAAHGVWLTRAAVGTATAATAAAAAAEEEAGLETVVQLPPRW